MPQVKPLHRSSSAELSTGRTSSDLDEPISIEEYLWRPVADEQDVTMERIDEMMDRAQILCFDLSFLPSLTENEFSE